MGQAKKVLVVGLDSGSFDVALPLVRRGELPHIGRLLKEGVWGHLESTFPPVTPPAWSSFMTGKNPGRHGIFDFYAPPSAGYDRAVLSARSIKGKTLWKILSDEGKQVGTINVPMTHPPEKINGFVIPGLQYSFGSDHAFTHPPELLKEIQEKVGAYEVVFGDEKSVYTDELDDFIERWERIHEIRRRTALYLMETRPWDFFMVVFSSIDLIQHHLWKFHDPAHPLHNPQLRGKYGHIIEEFYRKIDAAIGELTGRLEPGSRVFVVSDHGAGPELRAFYLNRWLMQEGYLAIKKGYYPLVDIKFPHLFYKLLRRLKVSAVSWTIPMSLYALLKDRVDPRDGLSIPQVVDWSRTRAFAGNHTEQAIYINLKGREPLGVVEPGREYEELREEILARLAALKDPESGEKVVDRAWKREELYHGPYVDQAADIYFFMKGGAWIARRELQYRELFRLPDKTSGTHRMNGLFILSGEGVKRGVALDGLKITDVAPTILYSMGLPVPDAMDGRVLLEGFEEGYVSDYPARYAPEAAAADGDDRGLYDAAEAQKIKSMLRGLGYMD